MIYFMQATDGGPVKIGFSGNVEIRRKQLEAHYGRPLAVLATMDGGRDEEAETHARFAHLRIGRTEQFQPAPDLMAFINRPLFVNQGDVELMPAASNRSAVIHLKTSSEFKAWADEFAADHRVSTVVMIEMSLIGEAKRRGFTKPAPKRTRR